MFNLLISYDPESWASSPYELDKSRAVVEYTDDEISERYKFFDKKAIEELKSFPTLFVTENEAVESRIGYITGIRLRKNTVVIDFEFDPILPSLKKGAIEELRTDIDLGRLELKRTHWAVKDEPIFEILARRGYISEEQLNASLNQRELSIPPVRPRSGQVNTSSVFIVHGHDELTKLKMCEFITDLGLAPVILHMQASSGRTIIEKIEHYTDVGFAIVLYTPCDVGSKADSLTSNYRARQNVVFEHGFLMGKLGRSRVVAVVKDEVEIPNDISGIVYISMDEYDNWKDELKKEMRDIGYQV